MKLWLVRHGETEANVAGLYSGHTPTPLTAKGQRQAQRLGEMLQQVPFDHVMCSELERTQHTARLLLGERDIPLTSNPLLNEMFFGDWEMRHHRDLQVEDKDWQNRRAMVGEAVNRLSGSQLRQAVTLLSRAELTLKQDYGQSIWAELESLSLLLCHKALADVFIDG